MMKGGRPMRKVKVEGGMFMRIRWKVVGKYGHASGHARIFCHDLETVRGF